MIATERLQKRIASCGVASRRAAEQLILAGRVRVNGAVVRELGAKVSGDQDQIEVDGVRIASETFCYVLFHKPRGVVSTLHDPEGRPTVKELLATVGSRVYPVGRLDFATSGVLLATNDGSFMQTLTHPRHAVPKTYVVKVNGVMSDEVLDLWRRGIELEDGKTRPAQVEFLRYEDGKTWFLLTLKEGRNQQIRRMGEATSFPVMRLARISFAGISAEELRPGEWRYLTPQELAGLKKAYGVPLHVPKAASMPVPVRSSSPPKVFSREEHASFPRRQSRPSLHVSSRTREERPEERTTRGRPTRHPVSERHEDTRGRFHTERSIRSRSAQAPTTRRRRG